jgi:hypothetical protein
MAIKLENSITDSKMVETYCSCCGTPNSKYNSQGHDKECMWYEKEMYRLAQEWLNGTEYQNHPFKKHLSESGDLVAMEFRVDWKKRYDLMVAFLLEQVDFLKVNNER